MRLGCHKGSFFTYRSLFGGLEVNTCAVLESTGKGLIENNDQNLRLITHVSKIIRDEALHLNKNLKDNFRKVTSKEINERFHKKLKNTYSYQIHDK